MLVARPGVIGEPDVRPAMPPLAHDTANGLQVLVNLRRNALSAFPARCLAEPVVRLSLPRFPLVLMAGGVAMLEVLQANATDYVRMPMARKVLGPVAGEGLLISEGERWRKQRRTMAPAFTPRAFDDGRPYRQGRGAACRRLEARGGAPIDLLREMQLLSLDIASASMFSVETSVFRAELRDMIAQFTSSIGRPALQDFLLPGWIPTPLALRRKRFRARWRQVIGGVVAQRHSTPTGEARDLFDLLAQAHGDNAESLLIDEVATMLVAGHETTALTLFWSLYLLAQSPGWRAAVTVEAAGTDLSPQAATAALSHLTVTRAVVNETLRLYSPAFMTARFCVRRTVAAGRDVPKGSMVLTPFWLLHRNPSVWPDPDRFDPQRFLDEPNPDRSRFMPFGTGPHVCIGAQLAISEAVLVLALLLRRRNVALVDPARPVLPVATLSTRPDHAPEFVLESLGSCGGSE